MTYIKNNLASERYYIQKTWTSLQAVEEQMHTHLATITDLQLKICHAESALKVCLKQKRELCDQLGLI